jgi:hypothetical protein
LEELKMTKKIWLIFICVIALAAQKPLAAEEPSQRDKWIAFLAADSKRLDDFIDNYLTNEVLAAGIMENPDKLLRKSFEEVLVVRRSDIQIGASNSSSGSTSSISSPLLPSIFGVSFENGGITRSVTGSTLTFRANPADLICASGTEMAAVARRNVDTCKTIWKQVGITASFDTSRAEKSSEIQNLQTLKNQFSELGVRWEVVNLRKVTNEAYNRHFGHNQDFQKRAKTLVNAEAQVTAPLYIQLRPKIKAALEALINDSKYKSIETDTDAGKKSRAELIDVELKKYQEEISDAISKAASPEVLRKLAKMAVDTFSAFRAQQDAVLNAPVFTVEYSFQQPDLATADTANSIVPAGIRPPNLHTARAIYAQGIASRRLDITLNASASWFQERRTGMSSLFRDFRAGGQATFRLREIPNYGVPTLSFAGLYTYLHQQPLGLGIVAFNDAQIKEVGHIGLFQAKLEFPVGKNGVRIPISFTASNRTELIKETEVRGQIGISFNLDSLFSEAK